MSNPTSRVAIVRVTICDSHFQAQFPKYVRVLVEYKQSMQTKRRAAQAFAVWDEAKATARAYKTTIVTQILRK